MFEEYDSLKTTYMKFYAASSQLKKRGRVLTYSSTIAGGILLFIIGTVILRNEPSWWSDVAFGLSIAVAALSFVNAVDNPQMMSNVCYNSGQTLQRVFLEFHYMVTVRLPDPDENLAELEEDCERLLERKHTVNETTPQLGDKWYYRAKERRSGWEPKPLLQVTGEDGEFKKESKDKKQGYFRKLLTWLGY